jgi:hypothetical protein
VQASSTDSYLASLATGVPSAQSPATAPIDEFDADEDREVQYVYEN